MKELTKAEEQIMQALWKVGSGATRDIIAQLPTPKPAYTTVATFLKIMEEKGFVSKKQIGNVYLFKPTIKKEDYSEKLLTQFAKKYFDGSMKKMVSFFIDSNNLSLKDFEELQEIYNKKLEK